MKISDLYERFIPACYGAGALCWLLDVVSKLLGGFINNMFLSVVKFAWKFGGLLLCQVWCDLGAMYQDMSESSCQLFNVSI
jgi:hypothetical protein